MLLRLVNQLRESVIQSREQSEFYSLINKIYMGKYNGYNDAIKKLATACEIKNNLCGRLNRAEIGKMEDAASRMSSLLYELKQTGHVC